MRHKRKVWRNIDVWGSHFSLTHRSLEGFLCNPVMKMNRKMISLFIFTSHGVPVEWNWQGKTEVLGEKPVPVSLCPPQYPTWTELRLNPGLRGGRPTTNREPWQGLHIGVAEDMSLQGCDTVSLGKYFPDVSKERKRIIVIPQLIRV
jgi:hypothetical protein